MANKEKPENLAGELSTIPSKVIKIKGASLHQAVSVPGLMNTDKTLNSDKCPKIDSMEWMSMGLVVKGAGRKAIIPHANVSVAIVDE